MNKEVLSDTQLIFIDDCSPINLKTNVVNHCLNFAQYRIDTDIKWNVGGAKNLGAFNSDAEKLLFLDADHSINESKIREIICIDLKNNECLLMMRGSCSAPGKFCTSRKIFLGLNGFDENFSGSYGYEDINYMIRHGDAGGFFTELKDAVYIRKGYHHHSLDRDGSRNKKIYKCKNHSGLFLNFKWHEVKI
jgi:glycosyltransferase involved in cell wall biosynthesis